MNLVFTGNVESSNILYIKDSNGNEIIGYSANTSDFISGSNKFTYFAVIVSHPIFKNGQTYHLFLDGVQLGFTRNKKGYDWLMEKVSLGEAESR